MGSVGASGKGRPPQVCRASLTAAPPAPRLSPQLCHPQKNLREGAFLLKGWHMMTCEQSFLLENTALRLLGNRVCSAPGDKDRTKCPEPHLVGVGSCCSGVSWTSTPQRPCSREHERGQQPLFCPHPDQAAGTWGLWAQGRGEGPDVEDCRLPMHHPGSATLPALADSTQTADAQTKPKVNHLLSKRL